ARRGRGEADRRYAAGRESESLESRRTRGDQRVLLDERSPRLRRPRVSQLRRVLPDEASLQRRGDRLPIVRRVESASRRRTALQHARDRNLRSGRILEAGARVEEGVRDTLRIARRLLAVLRREANAGGAGV